MPVVLTFWVMFSQLCHTLCSLGYYPVAQEATYNFFSHKLVT